MLLCTGSSISKARHIYEGTLNRTLNYVSGEPALSLALLEKICVTLGKVPTWLYPLVPHMYNEELIHSTFKNRTDFLLSVSHMFGSQRKPDKVSTSTCLHSVGEGGNGKKE